MKKNRKQDDFLTACHGDERRTTATLRFIVNVLSLDTRNQASTLTVTARRLDGPTPPPEIFRATGSCRGQDWKAFFVGGINFPTIGCWEITAHHDDHKLVDRRRASRKSRLAQHSAALCLLRADLWP